MEEVYIYLKFIDDNLNPDKITQLIGCEPTISGQKGEKIPGRHLPIKEGMWAYKHNLNTPWDVAKGISKLLLLIESNMALKEFCTDANIYIEFAIIMYLKTQTPIVSFDPSLMSRIINVNGNVDFDIYLLPRNSK